MNSLATEDTEEATISTTPILAFPLRGKEVSVCAAKQKLSLPLRGRVGVGVVTV